VKHAFQILYELCTAHFAASWKPFGRKMLSLKKLRVL
jgi:hypothetical protein